MAGKIHAEMVGDVAPRRLLAKCLEMNLNVHVESCIPENFAKTKIKKRKKKLKRNSKNEEKMVSDPLIILFIQHT